MMVTCFVAGPAPHIIDVEGIVYDEHTHLEYRAHAFLLFFGFAHARHMSLARHSISRNPRRIALELLNQS